MNANFLLRELRLSDAKSLAENANNIQIWNNLYDAFPHPYSEEDAKEFIKMRLDKSDTSIHFAIVVDDEVVGGLSITPQENVNLRITAELGYFIGEKYWGKGIMTEAIKQMVTYAFANLPQLQKIYAVPFDFNIASQKVLEKAGFEHEAILKKGAIKNDKVVDLHYFSRIREEKMA